MFQILEKVSMSKSRITTLMKIAIAFVVAGGASGAAVVIVALANGAVTFGGAQLVAIDPATVVGAVVGVGVASTLVGIGTAIAVAAWVGALLNTARLQDKAWFAALLVLGLVSLGWVAMIAYVLRGPDGSVGPAPSVA